MGTTNRKVVVYALLILALGAASFAARAETGLAAVYSHRLDGHQKTASGKIYKPSGMTVAHKSLPFGTVVPDHEQEQRQDGKSNGHGSGSSTNWPRA